MIYQFKTEQWLPISVQEAWRFFSSPMNLSLITPPELQLKVLTKMNETSIYNGMMIDYTVKPIMNIPLKWKTRIGEVKEGKHFMDKQLKGPYKLWEHSHMFQEQDGGVLMTDIVNYQLPFGLIGRIAHRLFVRSKIVHIFDYRKKILNQMFPA